MNAHRKPKRRHHHVWQYYLSRWTKDGSLFCLQDGRIFASGTRAVAVEKDFYKLQRLTREDAELLKLIFGNSHPYAVKSHAEFLNRLMLPFQFAEQLKDSPFYGFIESELDDYASNVLEDHHAGIEASFIPSLERALSGDIGFYGDDQQCIPFLNYLCTQYMRTRGVKERFIKANPPLERIWNVAMHMSATNIGCSLYLERRNRALVIVNNSTDMPFITGDQPAINLKGARPQPTDHLAIFYPISPTTALLLADVDEAPPFPPEGLTREQALELNRLVLRASHRQVFARSAAPLEEAAATA